MGMLGPISKCPHCQKIPSFLLFETTLAKDSPLSRNGWKTITFACPDCHAIVSTQIDPVAIRSEILEHVEKVIAPLVQEQSALRSQIATLQETLERILRPQR